MFSFLFTFYCMIILLQTVSLYVIISNRSKLNKIQFILIINLCMTDFLWIIINLIALWFEYRKYIKGVWLLMKFVCGFILLYTLSLIAFTLNRFFEIYLNTKYDLFLTYKRMKVVILIIWIIRLFYLIISAQYQYEQYIKVYRYVNIILFGIFFVAAIITYGYINFKSYKNYKVKVLSRVQFNLSANQQTEMPETWKRELIATLIPDLIMFSYVVFLFIPECLMWHKFFFAHSNKIKFTITDTTTTITSVMFGIGLSLDSYIYLLLNPILRKHFTCLLKCCTTNATVL